MNYSYLREKKAKRYAAMSSGIQLIAPNMHTYQNAIVLPVRKNELTPMFGWGGVFSNDRQHISFPELNGFGGIYEYAEDELIYIDKKAVYLGPFIKHWGHFLMDACSRCWYCLKDDDSIDEYILLTEESSQTQLTGNYKEFFELLGITKKLVLIDKPVKYREILIPDLGVKKAEYYSFEQADVFKTVRNNALKKSDISNKTKGVYLSRQKFSQTEFGEKTIAKFFKNNAFEIIYPEQKTLTELIGIMNSAEICASASGSGSFNYLFLKEEKKAITIDRTVIPDPYVVAIEKMTQFQLVPIDANISLFPVTYGGGPFIYIYNQYLDNYAIDSKNKRLPIQKGLVVNILVRKYLRAYMDTYSKYLNEWVVKDLYDVFKEAYDESISIYQHSITKTSGLKRIKWLPTILIDSLKKH